MENKRTNINAQSNNDMMQRIKYNLEVSSQSRITRDVFYIYLKATDWQTQHAINSLRSGQFVNLQINHCYLRRPISVCKVEDGKLMLAYKVVGKGTTNLTYLKEGEIVETLMPLGNGFKLERAGNRPLLIGGGIGTAPLVMLAKELTNRGAEVDVVLGFNSRDDIILDKEFDDCRLTIATMDGSAGVKGTVVDALKKINSNNTNSFFYSCGPTSMLKAVQEHLTIDGQISTEEHMGCGFGLCMGCTCMTKDGPRQVCKDGPVFDKNSIEL